MKKIYSLMVVAVLALVSSFAAMADEVTFSINIDNPEAVAAKINSEPVTLVAGDNEFTVEEYSSVEVKGLSPYSISVTDENGQHMSTYDNTWYFYPSTWNHGKYYITSVNLDEARTASCTVNIDCADMVNAVLGGTFSSVQLVDGENIVKFDPEKETVLSITAKDYMVPLYKVTVDGVNVAKEQGVFDAPLSQGCVVDITAKIPEVEVTVKIDYSANEKGVGAIAAVAINNVPLEDFNGESFTAIAGSTVTLTSNSDYKIQSVSINGSEIGWAGGYPYSFVLVDNTEIAVNAAPYGTISATVLIDDPANITLFRGYEYQGIMIPLEAGKNVIELKEGSTMISWKANNGCLINTVMQNNEILSDYVSGVSVADGDVIEFITSKIVMDSEFIFWIDDRSAADLYFSLSGADRTSVDVTSGYNIVEYSQATMVPFALSWYSNNKLVNKVYVDGEYLASLYEESNSYELPIENHSVVKVFLATEPEECNVKVNVNDQPDVTVAYDIVTPVTDFPAEINVFKGTLFTITPAEGEEVSVVAAGVEVAPNEDGIYEIEIAEVATEITVAKTSAIKSVANEAANGDIFNMMGVKVGSTSDFNRLPAGIYIMGGKKVIKK